MTKITSYIIYFYLYFLIYGSPIILLYWLDANAFINIEEYLDKLGNFKIVLGVIAVILLFFLPIYRAKIAAEAYGNRDIKFWEAHTVSKAILRANLSYIPIIGNLFRPKGK